MSAESAVAGVAGAAGATNTASPNGAAAAPQAPAPAASAPWYADFKDPDLKGWVELNNISDVEALAKSAREHQKMLGGPKDELVRIPKNATPEDMAKVYEHMGRPKTAAEYQIPSIPGDEASARFTEAMKPMLHGIGLTQAQAVQLKQGWDTYQASEHEAQRNAQTQRDTVELAELRREWGPAFEVRDAMATRGIRGFALPLVGGDKEKAGDLLDKLDSVFGLKNCRQFFANLQQNAGKEEATTHGMNVGSSSFRGMTPDAARVEKQQLMTDKVWSAKTLIKGSPEAAQLDRLQRIESGMA